MAPVAGGPCWPPVKPLASALPLGCVALVLTLTMASLARATEAPVAPPAPAATRAAFLQLIARDRVPPAAELKSAAEADGVVTVPFTYATEAGERVPGLLLKKSGSTGRRPVIIALHGTGGKKEDMLADLRRAAGAGFIGVAIDGRFHGARAPTGKAAYPDAILRAWQTGRGHPFFYDTVWDVMRLIDWLETREDVDAKRVGLFGISKGGIETYLAAAADPRIAVAVPCIGLESFRWALEHDAWQSRIGTIQAPFDAAAKEAGVTAPGAEFVGRFYDRVAPGLAGQFDGPAMVRLIAPRPLLAINGDSDARTPLPGLEECAAAARPAYAAAGVPEQFQLRLQPHTGHQVTAESHQAALDWFVRWLKP